MPRIIKLAKGTYTASTITVDGEGRVISASSGASAGGAMVMTQAFQGPASGTLSLTGNYGSAYAAGGGGGGGGAVDLHPAGYGGAGGWGVFNFPIGESFSEPYVVGTGGGGGTSDNNGQASTGTTVANVLTINAANGGVGENNGSPGQAGTAPGATVTGAGTPSGGGGGGGAYATLFGQGYYKNRVETPSSFMIAQRGAAGQGQNSIAPTSGGGGGPGMLVIFENIGS